jgi:hypothetical protein
MSIIDILIESLTRPSHEDQVESSRILSGLDVVMNLIDDAFIWGTTEEEHDINLNAVL